MTGISDKTIMERTELIEDALAQAFELDGIAIECSQGERELVVAKPGWQEDFYLHDLWAIAREVERRLFPNG
nr:hypothetical protein [uncultured Celeribacter sp.]